MWCNYKCIHVIFYFNNRNNKITIFIPSNLKYLFTIILNIGFFYLIVSFIIYKIIQYKHFKIFN